MNEIVCEFRRKFGCYKILNISWTADYNLAGCEQLCTTIISSVGVYLEIGFLGTNIILNYRVLTICVDCVIGRYETCLFKNPGFDWNTQAYGYMFSLRNAEGILWTFGCFFYY